MILNKKILKIISLGTMLLILFSSAVSAQQSRVFVTSETSDGNMGGLAGADAICQRLGATVDGSATWVAWLSTLDPLVNARDRLVATGPFVLATNTGITIANDIADLTDNTLISAINADETGAASTTFAWTGTLPDGTALTGSGETQCENWTSNIATGDPDRGQMGETAESNVFWTSSSGGRCDLSNGLYCFEQTVEGPPPPQVEPATPIPTTGSKGLLLMAMVLGLFGLIVLRRMN